MQNIFAQTPNQTQKPLKAFEDKLFIFIACTIICRQKVTRSSPLRLERIAFRTLEGERISFK
jgi:hypothetical protein